MLPGSGVIVVMLRDPMLPGALKQLKKAAHESTRSVPSDLQPFVHVDVKLNVARLELEHSPSELQPASPEKDPPVIVPVNEYSTDWLVLPPQDTEPPLNVPDQTSMHVDGIGHT